MHLKISGIPYYKWLLISKVLVLNAVIVTIALSAMYCLEDLNSFNFRDDFPTYFYSVKNFPVFFKNTAWNMAIREETYYRGFVWILIVTNLSFSIRGQRLDGFLIWIAVILPTAFWAYTHQEFGVPIFFVGLSWGWLIVKTKSLWPAFFCHITANVVIFFALKIFLIFK